FVPAFYLGGFTADGRRETLLWVFDRKSGGRFRAKPDETGYQRDYNRVDLENVDPNAVEDLFAAIESSASIVLRRIMLSCALPEGEDFDVLMMFLAASLVRNPRIREAFAHAHEAIARRRLKISVASKDMWDGIIRYMKITGKHREL